MRRVALALLLLGCSSDPAPAGPEFVDTAMPRAVDQNPDPGVVEVSLEAKVGPHGFTTGVTTKNAWTYSGTIPGPLIDAKVGDRLIVHLKNSLPETTTIHWHGVRLPAAMDGTMLSQMPIEPGQTFTYEFTLKDAGLFWYHPHMRSDVQVNAGLYGVIRVRGPNEPVVDREEVVVLDDLSLKADGSIEDYLDDESKMMGRGGDLLLVNGAAARVFTWQPGSRVRLRIVNAANGRFFNLALSGHTFRVIGGDAGFLAKPYDTDHVLVAPGERYDVIVVPQGSAPLALVNDPYDRGHDSGAMPRGTVATIALAGAPTSGPLPTSLPAFTPLADRPTDHTLVLDEKLQPSGDVVFTINGKAFPDVPVIKVPLGETRAFEVKNDAEMDHPFHLHGFFFDIVQKDGKPLDPVLRKDTVIVPKKSSLKFVARFDASGTWVYHCHILEHAESGMMGTIQVE
ncbi:MAG: multicopper oxidase family protein [Myxococcales bacterium]|nr:multicopper oxidase family protein [Myxococcales bacterium]